MTNSCMAKGLGIASSAERSLNHGHLWTGVGGICVVISRANLEDKVNCCKGWSHTTKRERKNSQGYCRRNRITGKDLEKLVTYINQPGPDG